jgi:quinoprotein glucose dehydrogenase
MRRPPVRAERTGPAYGHDPAAPIFRRSNRLTAANVVKLRRAWTYHTGEPGPPFESSPSSSEDASTSLRRRGGSSRCNRRPRKEIWSYDAKTPGRESIAASRTGAATLRTPPRIFFGTGDGRLIAIDAATGRAVSAFGDTRRCKPTHRRYRKFPRAGYAITSPPAIYRDLVIVGPSTQEARAPAQAVIRAPTTHAPGKLVWRFHTVPQRGEPGDGTWGAEGWKNRSGPSLWGLINVDTQRGLVLLATGNPADSFYGGDRKGTNLYANCVLALDAASGSCAGTTSSCITTSSITTCPARPL